MKKILAFLFALSLLIGGGINVSVNADTGGYLDIPDWYPITDTTNGN